MRSAGTDSHRVPHTGITRFDEGLTPVPAAALSVPDANQLARLTALGSARVRLALDCGWDGTATSYNVIGEITGRSKPKEVVVIGGHLDSWDLGTGAIDDGAGVAITMAAGHLIGQLKQPPKRTIRVVAFANEEQGLHGGKAYAAAHGNDAKDMALHQIGAESDFGAGRIYAFNTGAAAPDDSRAATKQIAEVLAPLGIAYEPSKGGPGPDVGPISAKGGAWGGWRRMAPTTSTCTTPPTTRWTRSTRRRSRRTWPPTPCSHIWPQKQTAISAAAPRACNRRTSDCEDDVVHAPNAGCGSDLLIFRREAHAGIARCLALLLA